MTATPATGKPYPQWMELTENAGKMEGRIQPRGGAWRPIVGAHLESGKLMVDVGPAGPSSATSPEISWELTSSGAGKLTGMEKRGDADGPMLAGVQGTLARPTGAEAVDEARATFRR